MANARINVFQNIDLMQRVSWGFLVNNNQLHIHGVYIPGSLSFNSVAVLISRQSSTNTVGFSFGLYSLNGTRLSLANSASFSSGNFATGSSWFSLNTSATQDITPGNWYLAGMSSISLWQPGILINESMTMSQSAYGGPFIRGVFSATTAAMPASIATSDIIKEGGNAAGNYSNQPYILISA